MPNLINKFNEKIIEVKTLESISDENKLYLYKYYKQATIGDINIERPGFFNLIGKTKWDAWNTIKGTSKEEAMNSYIQKVEDLLYA
jgi:diazepam-binding inhibitor (GABA receptor modulator, acyl-CoA-binding protein)